MVLRDLSSGRPGEGRDPYSLNFRLKGDAGAIVSLLSQCSVVMGPRLRGEDIVSVARVCILSNSRFNFQTAMWEIRTRRCSRASRGLSLHDVPLDHEGKWRADRRKGWCFRFPQ